MPKFRKKPVVIEAFQLPTEVDADMAPFRAWAKSVGFAGYSMLGDRGLLVATLEGTMQALPGDWIIKGVAGEFYPCKPAIFAATYEAA